jgi:hypothetical protein
MVSAVRPPDATATATRDRLVNSSKSAMHCRVAVGRGDRVYATSVYEDVASWTFETCMRHPPFALFIAVHC